MGREIQHQQHACRIRHGEIRVQTGCRGLFRRGGAEMPMLLAAPGIDTIGFLCRCSNTRSTDGAVVC
jgi:hypothetical protein